MQLVIRDECLNSEILDRLTTITVKSRSPVGGGRGCHKLVPVLRGDGTKIAPPGDVFDQPPGEMS